LLIAGGAYRVVVAGAAPAGESAKTATFEELRVGRITFQEPDGTPRLVIANRISFPGTYLLGRERPRSDRRDLAGMVFLDDEGSEVGGLTWRGKLDAQGEAHSALALTFDRVRQDQTVRLSHAEAGEHADAGLEINDQPAHTDGSIADLLGQLDGLSSQQRQAKLTRLRVDGKLGRSRAFIGTTADGGAAVVLADAKGARGCCSW
jgi:hypothetical protein